MGRINVETRKRAYLIFRHKKQRFTYTLSVISFTVLQRLSHRVEEKYLRVCPSRNMSNYESFSTMKIWYNVFYEPKRSLALAHALAVGDVR